MPDAKPKPPGLDAPSAKVFIKWMSRVNTWLYRATGGRLGGTWRVMSAFRKPVPVLLLEHTGRSSGRAYRTPLLFLEDGDDLVIVASSGGLAEHPQWFHNLVADPQVAVQIGSRREARVARVATGEERERLWPRLVDHYADFDTYRTWTERQIPVIVLEPI